MGRETKYKLTKKGVKEEYFCLKLKLLVKKRGGIYVIYQISDKVESKKVVRNLGRYKMEIFFPKKVIRRGAI